MSARARFGARLAAALAATGALVWSASSVAAPVRANSVTVSNIKLSASWRRSWLTASVKFTIAAAGPASVDISIRPVSSGPVAAHKIYSLESGSTTETLALPPRLAPRAYTFNVNGASSTTFTIPVPPEGIVDTAAISQAEGGTPLTTVAKPKVLWARFHFEAKPSSKTVTVVWETPGFKYVGKVDKPYATTVNSDLSSNQVFASGNYYAYLKVGAATTYVKEVHVT